MEYDARDIVFLLLNVLFEAVFLGAFGALTCFVIWMLVHELRLAQKILFSTSICLFALAAVQIGFLVQQLANAPNVPNFNVRAQVLLYAIILALGDCILIWRVWAIWENGYIVVAIPISLTIATFVLTLREAIRYQGGGFFTLNTDPAIALSATNTSLCTLLIAGRIWYQRRRIRRLTASTGMNLGDGLMSGVLFLIETGALFTCTQILVLVFKPLGSADAFSIIMNLEMPLIGMLPTMLIVVVYLRKFPGQGTTHTHTSHTTIRFTHRIPTDKTVFDPEDVQDATSSLTRVASGSSHVGAV